MITEETRKRLEAGHDKKRARCIEGYRNQRKEAGEEPTNCIFNVTVPRFSNSSPLEKDENIKVITDLFDKYGIEWQSVDTVEGSFNLNRDWIETTTDIPCYIEYCGVYPVNWSPEDCRTLEKLDYRGDVIIQVLYHIDGKYIPNHQQTAEIDSLNYKMKTYTYQK